MCNNYVVSGDKQAALLANVAATNIIKSLSVNCLAGTTSKKQINAHYSFLKPKVMS